MKDFEKPIWHGESHTSRAQVITLDNGELLICFNSDDISARMSFTVALPSNVAELLASNILVAVSAAQIKAAA